MLVACIEGGGTNFNCALFDLSGRIMATHRVATAAPEPTMQAYLQFFRAHSNEQPIVAAGMACFGPLELSEHSDNYGQIVGTPKPDWSGFNPAKTLSNGLGIPVQVTTDVGGAAIGEWRIGAAQGLSNFVYVTVGTGIGAAVFVEGKLLFGESHPEFGHINVARVQGDTYEGCCSFHKECVSGLASGPAMANRWKQPAEELDRNHPAWWIEADYLAQLCVSAIYSYAPSLIVVGGGVMNAPGLLAKLRERVVEKLGGYHCHFLRSEDDGNLDAAKLAERAIVMPQLGAQSALVGAFYLARKPEDNWLAMREFS